MLLSRQIVVILLALAGGLVQASFYTGKFNQHEYRYSRSISNSTCTNYANHATPIEAPHGWLFELSPGAHCSFRLTKVKNKSRSSDEIHISVFQYSDQAEWSVEKIRARQLEVGYSIDVIEITPLSQGAQNTTRSFITKLASGVTYRSDEYAPSNKKMLIIITSPINIHEPTHRLHRIYSALTTVVSKIVT